MQILRLDARTLKTLLATAALAAVPNAAKAFDCAKASNKFEKAICADPGGLAADAAMSKAFSDLAANPDAKTRAALTGAQIAWLTERNNDCSESKPAELSACLTGESDRQSRSAKSSSVVVPKLRHSRSAALPECLRMQATTLSL